MPPQFDTVNSTVYVVGLSKETEELERVLVMVLGAGVIVSKSVVVDVGVDAVLDTFEAS